MIKTLSREIAGFIRSGFGELKISEARYEDPLGEADEYQISSGISKALANVSRDTLDEKSNIMLKRF